MPHYYNQEDRGCNGYSQDINYANNFHPSFDNNNFTANSNHMTIQTINDPYAPQANVNSISNTLLFGDYYLKSASYTPSLPITSNNYNNGNVLFSSANNNNINNNSAGYFSMNCSSSSGSSSNDNTSDGYYFNGNHYHQNHQTTTFNQTGYFSGSESVSSSISLPTSSSSSTTTGSVVKRLVYDEDEGESSDQEEIDEDEDEDNDNQSEFVDCGTEEFSSSEDSVNNFGNNCAAIKQEPSVFEPASTKAKKPSANLKPTVPKLTAYNSANIEKPPEPYADMIAKAILSSPSNMLQLKGIYDYISEK
jgi:hypothetical protein